jgi:hypothetical protein
MIYEARHWPRLNQLLAGACALLSILGFAVAGVIPTRSGSYPLVGWAIVVACFAAAALFARRAMNDKVQARVDENGVLAPSSDRPVPWDRIVSLLLIRAGIQRIVRFEVRDARTFGINTTFYDRGVDELLAAIRHYRPDLIDGSDRL